MHFPDGSLIRRGHLPHDVPPRGHVRIVQELLIEVVSPNDLAWEVEAKVTEYLRAGVSLLRNQHGLISAAAPKLLMIHLGYPVHAEQLSQIL